MPCMDIPNMQLRDALHTLIQRQAGKQLENGRLEKRVLYKRNGVRELVEVWLPSELFERKTCCDTVKVSARSPLNLASHCRTATHVAQLFNVDKKELLRVWREWKRQDRADKEEWHRRAASRVSTSQVLTDKVS